MCIDDTYVYDQCIMERIQVLLDSLERERFKRLAQTRGLSLSAWMREAALKQASVESRQSKIRSVEALRAFFAECDSRETGLEPDWPEHVAVLDTSRRQGAGEPSAAAPGESVRPGPAKGQTGKRPTARKRR